MFKIKTINDFYNIVGDYFDNDIWNLKRYPLKKISSKYSSSYDKTAILDFSNLKNKKLKLEIKFYLKNFLESTSLTKVNIQQSYVNPIKKLIKFIVDEDVVIISLSKIDNEFEEDYRYFLENKIGIKTKGISKGYLVDKDQFVFLRKINKYFKRLYFEGDFFERDFWPIKKLNLSNQRTDNSKKIKGIHFKNINNKKLVKEFTKHLIKNTKLSFATFNLKKYKVQDFLNYYNEYSINEIDRRMAENYIEHLSKKDNINKTFNSHITSLIDFYKFLLMNNKVEKPIFFDQDYKKEKRSKKNSSIDDYVINQIFLILDQIPYQYQCMYLLLVCLGMRISEVCTVKIDSLYKKEEYYFIEYYQTKMKKEVSNPIPKVLYNMLEKQRQIIMNKYDKNAEYLFPSTKNKAFSSVYFKRKMDLLLADYDIKNLDGSRYKFNSHDYRHTLATKMIKKGISIDIIQKTLHHESPEMSLSYIDEMDERKINRYKKMININGEKQSVFLDKELQEVAEVKWLKEHINAQSLPNGVCALPVGLGDCPHANSCLVCEYFRTSCEFLSVHKKQLETTNKLLEKSKKNNWKMQIETNTKVKENLINIIKTLEKE